LCIKWDVINHVLSYIEVDLSYIVVSLHALMPSQTPVWGKSVSTCQYFGVQNGCHVVRSVVSLAQNDVETLSCGISSWF
jgi:hypothetical protein